MDFRKSSTLWVARQPDSHYRYGRAGDPLPSRLTACSTATSPVVIPAPARPPPIRNCPFSGLIVRSFNSTPPSGSLSMDVATLNEDAFSLPSWIYRDPEFFELEKQTIFRQAWQLVCHTSDVPNTGDYHSFEFMGESVIVLRGEDGQIRSFHNACRHRASRLLDDPKGHCGRRITCPYHAW